MSIAPPRSPATDRQHVAKSPPADDDTPDVRQAAPAGRDAQAFPRLSDDQIDRVAEFSHRETLPDGAVVFQRGQRMADFFVLVSGCIEIYDFDCEGDPHVFTRHCDGQFTGEIDLFSDRKVLVGGRSAGQSEVLRLGRDEFREMLAAEPDVGDIVIKAFILRRIGILEGNLGGALLIGRKDDGATLRIRSFLRRNGYPARTAHFGIDDLAQCAMDKHGLTADDLPALLCHGEEVLKKPTVLDVAKTVGILESPDPGLTYDVAVIGSGPGGMAAAVYAASEGLKTVVLESNAPGGQAGTSSKIENYLGFPNGLSGQELAGRAQVQAQKFGATLALPMRVTGITGDAPPYEIHLNECDPVKCRSIVIASGATYRKLGLENDDEFDGCGIHYAATAIEAGLCEDQEVVVVGGGNSAGQAAVFLSKRTRHVHILVRGDSLAASMSDYLVRRIEASKSITLHRGTEITALRGDGHLRSITWRDGDGHDSDHDIEHVFLMIGAVPNTQWVGDSVQTDKKGFICTGAATKEQCNWPLSDRDPGLFETSLPAVFAIGDVRSESVKRVASAVGEGSICIQFVHQVLA